ncbi:MAG: Pyruvate, water dikinase [Parcubacteria group bacterium]|nr:Pyruvate, water dikinase [Parcubacteria group bacterium]
MNTSEFTSPVLKDFDPEGYHFFGLWKQNLFSACFWAGCYSKEVADRLGIETEESGVAVLTEGNFFIKDSELANIRKQIREKIETKDEAFFKNMVKVSDDHFKEAVAFTEIFKNKELTPETFEEYLVLGKKITFLWMLGAEQFSEHAQEKLTEVALAESFPVERIPEIIPKFDTPLNQQHREMIELKKEVGSLSLEEIKKNKELYSKIEDHTKRFGWIEIANLVGDPLTVERLYEQIIHAKDEHAQEAKNLPTISENLAFHARCVSYCGYLRQAGAEYFFMMSEKAQPYLMALGEKFGLSYPEFLLQIDVEIIETLKGNISADILKANVKRREAMDIILFAGKGEEVFFTEEPEDIEKLKKLMLPQADLTSKEIKGQIGNKGTYTGPAKIIMNTHDFAKMQTGDVLVSTMTTPDFVVLMHKAGAIVTDIGGMLCHAAIVSREINKPCVIGTKFATQILKDGDLIEVDADKGVVTILERP